jgi:hypothetical protein
MPTSPCAYAYAYAYAFAYAYAWTGNLVVTGNAFDTVVSVHTVGLPTPPWRALASLTRFASNDDCPGVAPPRAQLLHLTTVTLAATSSVTRCSWTASTVWWVPLRWPSPPWPPSTEWVPF